MVLRHEQNEHSEFDFEHPSILILLIIEINESELVFQSISEGGAKTDGIITQIRSFYYQ